MSERDKEDEEMQDAGGLEEVTATASIDEQAGLGPDRVAHIDARFAQTEASFEQTEAMEIDDRAPDAPEVDLPLRPRPSHEAARSNMEDIPPQLEIDLPQRSRPTLRRWASHSSLGDIPSPPATQYYEPEATNASVLQSSAHSSPRSPAGLTGDRTEDTTSSPAATAMTTSEVADIMLTARNLARNQAGGDRPETPEVREWRANGRPRCSVCEGFHPPPCVAHLARRAMADLEFRKRDPKAFESHRRWRKRQQRRANGQNAYSAQPQSSPRLGPCGVDMRVQQNEHVPPPQTVPQPSAVTAEPVLSPEVQAMADSLIQSLTPSGLQDFLVDPRARAIPGLLSYLSTIAQQQQTALTEQPAAVPTQTGSTADANMPPSAMETEDDNSSPAPQSAGAERNTPAQSHGADGAVPSGTSSRGPSADFRTGSELALARALESGRTLSAKAAGKQAKK